jgi:hypothetical protein
MALIIVGCSPYYYAKDLREKNIIEFNWLKKMEDYVFNKKNDTNRTPSERLFYMACFFDAEMQRGGFSLFFSDLASGSENDAEADFIVQDTLLALKSMRMDERANLLEEAYSRYKELITSAAAQKANKAESDALLGKYSQAYYRLSSGDAYYLEGLIVKSSAFVEKNIDDFYIMH